MQYRRLGRSGLKVSVFSLGSWVTYGGQVGLDPARQCIHAALDAGINFFDNAEAYAAGQAEVVVGKVLKEVRRESLVISSKVFWGGGGPNDTGLSRKHVVEACHLSLKRLQVDYLDLYYCHRPDPDTPLEETVMAMDLLVRQGKVLYWGTSEWDAQTIERAYVICDKRNLVPPSAEQPQYNLFHRQRVEDEYAPLYKTRGIGLTTWSPLASGVLTGKYNGTVPEGSRLTLPALAWLKDELLTAHRLQATERLNAVAKDLGCTTAQLALAWAAANPQVSSVITGASRPQQVVENMGALPVLEHLDTTTMQRINATVEGTA